MKTLTQLEKDLAALPDESVAERAKALLLLEAAAASQKRQTLLGRIAAVRAATSTLAELAPQIAQFTKWYDDQGAWRKRLCDELLALPKARTGPELGTQQNLKLSIIVLDRGDGAVDGTGYAKETLRLGTLMRESGYVPAPPVDGQAVGRLPWLGSMPYVEQRLRDLQQRHDDAQARLDAALRDDA